MAWTQASVSYLKVFGCVCYILIPAERRTKLEERSVPGIFVGYSSTKKGYRICDPSTKKILVSRDVKFDEEKTWSWDGSNASQFEEDLVDGSLELVENELSNANVDDPSVRGTRSIDDIYQRCIVAIVEPSSFEEAVRSKHWKKAMKVEIDMIRKNDTWDLVDRPDQKKIIGIKWVFRAKFNADGSLNKHKARLVVKGYSQQYGIDFMETFAPVARLDTIKLLFAIAAQKQLKKALYGLKQAPRVWYDKVDAYLSRLGFEKSMSEPTLYVKKSQDETLLIVSIYVDDLLMTGSKDDLIQEFKTQMQDVFDMTDLGTMTYFLGMEVNHTDQGIFVSQYAFALKILNKFCMANCKIASTPLAQAGQALCMHCCNVMHFKAAKRVLRYIKGTLSYEVKFEKGNELRLVGYSDSDWAGSVDDMKSTSGYFFTLGSSVFCWSSKKQQTVAQS
ncbi:pleiotropic drug resistance protein 3-like [Gossypium australe]|uniref:Pleiotropic drug resistance protein 3-like n=1 Tax=Gossypium australe TaxID=47621 RepID=A0A5B6WZ97_9ROSI|nr:pleiotropic drug resistance protein 3-like [Gossypium australe]